MLNQSGSRNALRERPRAAILDEGARRPRFSAPRADAGAITVTARCILDTLFPRLNRVRKPTRRSQANVP